MTLTCKCGVVIAAPEDPILDADREVRRFAALSQLYGEHCARYHDDDARLALLCGNQLTGWMLLAFLSTTSDPTVNGFIENARQSILQVITNPEGARPKVGVA